MFICETWIRPNTDFPLTTAHHKSYIHPRQQQSHLGRPSGGVALFIKHSITRYVKKVFMDKQETISVLFDKAILGLDKDVLMCFVYIPPEGASYYHDKPESNGVYQLELDLLDLTSKHPNTHLLIAGDFNARTGNKQDFIHNDNMDFTDFAEFYPCDGFDAERLSRDEETNTFGESIIELSCSFGVHMLNGRYTDRPGEFTCLPSTGKSVVDYIIMDTELHSRVKSFAVLPNTDSDHHPIACDLWGAHHIPSNNTAHKWTRYKWKEENRAMFTQRLHDDTGRDLMLKIENCLDIGDADGSAEYLTDLLTHASKSMVMREYRPARQPPWWDEECEERKQTKYRRLNVFRRTRTEEDLQAYKQSRKEFRLMCDVKAAEFKESEKNRLIEESRNPRNLWKCMRRITRDSSVTVTIDPDEWYNYFELLTNGNRTAVDENFLDVVKRYLVEHDENCNECSNNHVHYDYTLNREIVPSEIKVAIDCMKTGKAPGPDGLSIEFYKNMPENVLLPLLSKLYNIIMEKGKFPEKWCQAIICPLYKGKGSKHLKNNYRGISLLNVIGKVFTKVLNNRFVNWTEKNELLKYEQIGYRQGFSTVDHLFSMQAIVQKYLTRKAGRIYILYVDFSKAFDCIQHDILWYVLLKNGCHGNFITVIRDMYSKLTSCVKTSSTGLSNYFKCELGTRQGCMLSPALFIQFLNEYINMLNESDCKGVFITEELPNLLGLMYADDIGNVTDTVGRLQCILNTLASFCYKFGMKVNVDKTQIMVFRNGGPLRRNEKWFYKGQPVKVTSYYDYLGLTVSCVMNWSKATHKLAMKALKAVHIIKKFALCCNCTDVLLLFSLFDKVVLPILIYGSEVCGVEYHIHTEKVHVRFCKYALNASSNVPDL